MLLQEYLQVMRQWPVPHISSHHRHRRWNPRPNRRSRRLDRPPSSTPRCMLHPNPPPCLQRMAHPNPLQWQRHTPRCTLRPTLHPKLPPCLQRTAHPNPPRHTPLYSRWHPRCRMERSRPPHRGLWCRPQGRSLPFWRGGWRWGRSHRRRVCRYHIRRHSSKFRTNKCRNMRCHSCNKSSNSSNKSHRNLNQSSRRRRRMSGCWTSPNRRFSTRRSATGIARPLRDLWTIRCQMGALVTARSTTTDDRGPHWESKFVKPFTFLFMNNY